METVGTRFFSILDKFPFNAGCKTKFHDRSLLNTIYYLLF